MNARERLYIAYGSNLNLAQMKHRCPTQELAFVVPGTKPQRRCYH